MLKKWCDNFLELIQSPSGWKHIAKIIVFTISLFVAIVTFQTYRIEKVDRAIERADQAFYIFSNQLSDSSELSRMGALYNASNVMFRKTPIIPNGYGQSIISFFKLKNTLRHHHNVKFLLYNYIKNLNNKNELWTKNEVISIIDLLSSIGAEGWFLGKSSNVNKISKNGKNFGLNWIWNNKYPVDASIPIGLIFNNVNFRELDFSNYHLEHSLFNKSNFVKSKFFYCNLTNIEFIGANLDSVKFDRSVLKNSFFNNSYCNSTSFYNTYIENLKFNESNMINCEFQESEIYKSYFNEAILNNSNFFNSELVDVDFSYAELNKSDFGNSKIKGVRYNSVILTNSDFSNTTLENTEFKYSNLYNVDFSNSYLKGIDFDGAYLKNADFSGVNIESDSINWENANIYKIKGLNKNELQILIDKGAVLIPSLNKWVNYLRQGRPHWKWFAYTEEQQ